MRRVVLLLLAMSACWRDDAKRTTPEPAPKLERASVQPDEPTQPPPSNMSAPNSPMTMSGPSGGVVGAMPCGTTLNASNAGIKLSAISRSTHTIDVCKQMDDAVAKVQTPARFNGFELEVEVATKEVVQGTTAHIMCMVTVDVVAPLPRRSYASGASKVQSNPLPRDVAAAAANCSSALIEHIFLGALFP